MSTIVTDLISHLQCGESISAGDAIYIDTTTGKIGKFDVTDQNQTFAGMAKEAGVLNDWIRVAQSGRIKGFTGLTPGVFIYASVTTPGGYQEIEPAASQKIVLGISKSSTELTINGGLGIKPGGDGGGGGLDVFYTQDMEALADTADFSKGNNAAFMGGGTMQGTLSLESVSPISKDKSLKYVQAAGSLNDYFASEEISLDPKQAGSLCSKVLYYTYDGNFGDIRLIAWDETNDQELAIGAGQIEDAADPTRYALYFSIPSTCTSLRWGAQVEVENIGATLVVDDVQMTQDPLIFQETTSTQYIALDTSNGNGSSGTKIRRFTNERVNTGGSILTYVDSPTNGASFTATRRCTVTAVWDDVTPTSGAPMGFSLNASSLTTNLTALSVSERIAYSSNIVTTSSDKGQVTATVLMEAGDVLRPHHNGNFTSSGVATVSLSLTAIAQSNNLVTSDSGTENVFSAFIDGTIATPVASQQTGGQFISSVTDLGTGHYRINFVSGFFTETPHVWNNSEARIGVLAESIFIDYSTLSTASVEVIAADNAAGTHRDSKFFFFAKRQSSDYKDPHAYNLIQVQDDFENSSSARIANNGTASITSQSANWIQSVLRFGLGAVRLTFNPGIFTVAPSIEAINGNFGAFIYVSSVSTTQAELVVRTDAGNNVDIDFHVTLNKQGADYTPPKGVSAGAMQAVAVAVIKDVKPSDTSGGTFTSGAWQTRTLNTISGSGFASLSANQITLQSGTYEVDVTAPALGVNAHKAVLYNITDAQDEIIGQSSYAPSTSSSVSLIKGTITNNSAKTYEIRHQCGITKATDGFGISANFGIDNIYTQVIIRKLK